MTKPISRSQYNIFTSRRQFATTSFSYSSAFIKMFDGKGLLTHDQIQRIKRLAKHSQIDAKEYIEDELIQGMGSDQNA